MAPKEPKGKICLYCGKPFIPKNNKAYFCRASHRVAFYKRKKRRQRQYEVTIALQKAREEMLTEFRERFGVDLLRHQEDIEWLRKQQDAEAKESLQNE